MAENGQRVGALHVVVVKTAEVGAVGVVSLALHAVGPVLGAHVDVVGQLHFVGVIPRSLGNGGIGFGAVFAVAFHGAVLRTVFSLSALVLGAGRNQHCQHGEYKKQYNQFFHDGQSPFL